MFLLHVVCAYVRAHWSSLNAYEHADILNNTSKRLEIFRSKVKSSCLGIVEVILKSQETFENLVFIICRNIWLSGSKS